MQDRHTVVLPRRADRQVQATTVALRILKVMEFSSQNLSSGVVVQSSDAAPRSALLFLRGAPGVIKAMVQTASVPLNFDQVNSQVFATV